MNPYDYGKWSYFPLSKRWVKGWVNDQYVAQVGQYVQLYENGRVRRTISTSDPWVQRLMGTHRPRAGRGKL